MAWFPKPAPFSSLTKAPAREALVRRGRIVLLDDDTPEVLQDLRANGFAVDHFKSVSDSRFPLLETGLYDLLLLDYGGIGHRIGADEGLDVLKHLRRVTPSLRIVAFTGRTFDSSKADFFRLCDRVLKKDAGIRETLENIEGELSIALTPAHQWNALLVLLGLAPQSEEAKTLEKALQKVVSRKGGAEEARAALAKYTGAGAKLVADAIVGRLLEYAATALFL